MLCPLGGQQTGFPHIRQQLVELGDCILRSGSICHRSNDWHRGSRPGRASRANRTLGPRRAILSYRAGGTLCAGCASGSSRTGGAGGTLRAGCASGSGRTGGAGGTLCAAGAGNPLRAGGTCGTIRARVSLGTSWADRPGNNRTRRTGRGTGLRAARWHAGLGAAGGSKIGGHALPLPPIPVCGQITIHHTIRSLFWDRSVWRPPHPSLCA